jgi:hypothetical protein
MRVFFHQFGGWSSEETNVESRSKLDRIADDPFFEQANGFDEPA